MIKINRPPFSAGAHIAFEEEDFYPALRPTGPREHGLTFFVTSPDRETSAHIASCVLNALLPDARQ